MAQRIVYFCDRCRKSAVPIVKIALTVGVHTDAAGSLDTNEDAIDLCPGCSRVLLQEQLGRLSHTERRNWLAAVRG